VAYCVEKSRDRRRGGAGIGLAIVRQRVELAGGRVGVQSAAGLTRFWFTIPTGLPLTTLRQTSASASAAQFGEQ
jgi:signal transduction histidine kinase